MNTAPFSLEKRMPSGVYKITNEKTGSCYVGSAVDIDSRWRSHRRSLRSRKKSPPKLQRAWDKHGEVSFRFSVVLFCSKSDLLSYEQLVIDALMPKYNTRPIASSNIGLKWSKETNAKKHARHRVHTVNGVTGCVKELADHFGVVSYGCAVTRISRGMSIQDAVLTPKMSYAAIGRKTASVHSERGTHPRGKLFTAFGVTDYLKNLVAKFSDSAYETVRMRVRRGMTLEEALIYGSS